MVDFEVGPAVAAGLVGGGVMIVLLYLGVAMMPRLMRMNLLLLLGTMAGMRGMQAYAAGLLMHLMASAVFAIIHAAVFAVGDIEDAVVLWGALFGLVHAAASGMGLAMMPMLHPQIRAGRMQAPGLLALSLGMPTAVGFVVLHIVFGAIVGGLYAAWT
jgi:hypothetical protein